MTAKIIAVVNQKGGAGKTTTSMQLAGTIARQEKKVLVVDADPQATATRWAASAGDDAPFLAHVIGLSAATEKLHREVKKFIDNYDVIIIDCPPAADSPVPQSALIIADLAIVPILPSPLDLWATVGIKQVIENARSINESLEARLLLNQIQPRTTLAQESMEVLTEFGIPLFKTELRQRQAYRQSAAFGATVHELLPKSKEAAQEMNSLYKEVADLLSLST
jgi:chromosome partitioning protein